MNDIQHIKKSLIQQFKNIIKNKNCKKYKSFITELEIIALTSMFLDHLYYLPIEFGKYSIYLKIIGRIAIPIYIYLIYQGVRKTKDLTEYRLRLFLLACVSEPVYQLYFNASFNFIWILFYSTFVYKSFIDKKNLMPVFCVSFFLSHYEPSFFFSYCYCFMFFYINSIYLKALFMLFASFAWGGVIQVFALLSLPIMKIDIHKYPVNRNLYRISYPLHIFIYFILTELYL